MSNTFQVTSDFYAELYGPPGPGSAHLLKAGTLIHRAHQLIELRKFVFVVADAEYWCDEEVFRKHTNVKI